MKHNCCFGTTLSFRSYKCAPSQFSCTYSFRRLRPVLHFRPKAGVHREHHLPSPTLCDLVELPQPLHHHTPSRLQSPIFHPQPALLMYRPAQSRLRSPPFPLMPLTYRRASSQLCSPIPHPTHPPCPQPEYVPPFTPTSITFFCAASWYWSPIPRPNSTLPDVLVRPKPVKVDPTP